MDIYLFRIESHRRIGVGQAMKKLIAFLIFLPLAAFGQLRPAPTVILPGTIGGNLLAPDIVIPAGSDVSAGLVASIYSSVALKLADWFGFTANVKAYGAKGDTQSVYGAVTITSGQAILGIATASFSASDVGKAIKVQGAGTAGATLVSTIASYQSAMQVTLANNAGTTVSTSQLVTWGTDDTAAFQAATTAVINAFGIWKSLFIYVPPGNYWISGAMPTCYHVACRFVGSTPDRSMIVLSPAFIGNFASWSEAWIGGTPGLVPSQPSWNVSQTWTAPGAENLGFIGDRGAAGTQDLFVFFDRNDRIHISHILVSYLTGHVINAGAQTLHTTQAYIRESYFSDIWVGLSAQSGSELFLFDNIGTGDSTNTIFMDDIRAWGLYGTGLKIVSHSTTKATGLFVIKGLILENGVAGVTNPQLQIGSSSFNGLISGITINDAQFVAGNASQPAIRLDGTSSTYAPIGVSIKGQLQTSGDGVTINYGRNLIFDWSLFSASGTGLTTASTAGSPIVFNANGSCSTITKSIANAASVDVSSNNHNKHRDCSDMPRFDYCRGKSDRHWRR
jgi:hypothetical protein